MTRVHLTEAQAEKLGIKTAGKKKSKKGMGRGGAVSICATCGERFTSDKKETEHMEREKHYRFEGETT